jgi:hypothetical protein
MKICKYLFSLKQKNATLSDIEQKIDLEKLERDFDKGKN